MSAQREDTFIEIPKITLEHLIETLRALGHASALMDYGRTVQVVPGVLLCEKGKLVLGKP